MENEEGIKDSAIVKKTLGGMETKAIEVFQKKCESIDFIIPLVGREDQVDRFLKNIRDDFVSSSNGINLVFVYFKENEHKEEIKSLRGKLANLKKLAKEKFICQLDFDVITSTGDFSRGIGLQMGADSRPMVRNTAQKQIIIVISSNRSCLWSISIWHSSRSSCKTSFQTLKSARPTCQLSSLSLKNDHNQTV